MRRMPKNLPAPNFPAWFWAQLRREDACLIWPRGTDKQGYGLVHQGRKGRKAHQVAYELHTGAAAAGLHVIQTCGRKLCCEPAHLEEGRHNRPVGLVGEAFAAWFLAQLTPQGDCLIWTKGRDGQGYGNVTIDGKSVVAHRVAFVLANGKLDPHLDVLHQCDNPPCCAPNHLRAGTHLENMQDMITKGRALFQTHPDRVSRGEGHWMRKPDPRKTPRRFNPALGRMISTVHARGLLTPEAVAEAIGAGRTTVYRHLKAS